LIRIFLDFDGTINDSSLRAYESYSRATKRLGGIPIDYNGFLLNKRNGIEKSALLFRSGIDISATDIFDDYVLSFIETESCLLQDSLYVWSLDLLSALSELDLELCLLTSRRRSDLLQRQIDNYFIREYFSDIFVETDKTAFLSSRDLDSTCIIIGDTEAEIVAARRTRISCVSVTWGMRSRSFLSGLSPEYLVDDFKELLEIITEKATGKQE